MGQDKGCRDPPIQHCPDREGRAWVLVLHTVSSPRQIPCLLRAILHTKQRCCVQHELHSMIAGSKQAVRAGIRTELLLLQRNPRNSGRVLVSCRAVLHGRAFRPKTGGAVARSSRSRPVITPAPPEPIDFLAPWPGEPSGSLWASAAALGGPGRPSWAQEAPCVEVAGDGDWRRRALVSHWPPGQL